MTKNQIHELIEIIVRLHEAGRLPCREKQIIKNILHDHAVKSRKPLMLYGVATKLTPHNLKSICKILVSHGYEILCGECGGYIQKPEDISIDHINARNGKANNDVIGGINDPKNTQPTHIKCNHRKGNKKCRHSYYWSVEIAVRYTIPQKLEKERTSWREKKQHPHTKPQKPCNHALHKCCGRVCRRAKE